MTDTALCLIEECKACMAATCTGCGHERCPGCIDDCDHQDCIDFDDNGEGTKDHECFFPRCKKHFCTPIPEGLT